MKIPPLGQRRERIGGPLFFLLPVIDFVICSQASSPACVFFLSFCFLCLYLLFLFSEHQGRKTPLAMDAAPPGI